MKKIYFFVLLLMGILTAAMAQGLQVSFECQYQNGNSLLLDSVQIKNQTRNWMMTVYYPNLTISLGDATNGITEVEFDNEGLARTIPNPFNGHTHAQLSLLNNEYIIMRIFDVAGKNVAYYEGQLTAGEHDFDLVLSTPQTYILQVKTTRKTYAIKMVNTGNGGEDKISLKASNNEVVPKSAKQIMDYDFEVGDLMYYQGFVTIDNEIVATEAITQNQYVSELITFTIHTTLPTVTTNMVSNITEISAICGGNVISTGGSSITARGVCWSISQNPTVSDNHTSDGSGTGSFTSNITGLTAGITYYIRAYATNSVGTAYGEQRSFTTTSTSGTDGQPCPGSATVTDIDNNTYNTVQIGSQCWMKENLRTTHYANGMSIPLGSTESYIDSYRYYPYNNASNVSTYGYLYNWKAVMESSSSSSANPSGVQGICPTGWHVPSDAEWTQLTNYVSSQSQYVCGEDSANIAKALASSMGWDSSTGTCAVGNDPSSNNATGFSALPAGFFDSYYADFWSATENGYNVYVHSIKFDIADVIRFSLPKCRRFSVRCVYNEGGSTLPTVTTNSISIITATYATCGGSVISDGGATVIARGVCWSTSQNPTVSGNHTSDGTGTGSFTSNITGLTAGTTYYVRAYATNSAGTAYGEQRSFTTPQLPTVTTTAVNNVTSSTATCGGNVTSDGGATVIARGVCWSTSQNPMASDNHTSDDTGTGSFTSNITGLTPATTYYVRAYAINSVDTAYGDQLHFTTPGLYDAQPCPGTATVTDYDNNTYNTVQIGNQCWMKENLRTTHYPNGTIIAKGSSNSTTTAYRYYPNDNYSKVSTYGYLYNWSAVMGNSPSSNANPSGVQGICPNGWHVPSYAEWTQLINYVSSQSQYMCDGVNAFIAKALASTTGWNTGNSCTETCGVINNPSANNATGFSALPAGYYDGYYEGYYGYFEAGVKLWSATEYSDGSVYHLSFCYDYPYVVMVHWTKVYGFSVRCVLNEGGSTSTVATNTVSNITATTATCGGNVIFDGGATVTMRGVCWSTSQNPTISDSHTTDGSGTGSFTSNLTGLMEATTYYVRAYATNSYGTSYGDEKSFMTPFVSDGQPCSGSSTVTDYDGNTYNTVQIGNQCWMKENLRTTHYSNGTSIALGSSTCTSTTTAYRYCPANASLVSTYGYLYNGKAVMGGSSSSSANPSGVQGICPTGWHVPSDAEWTQLTDYVSSQIQYACGDYNTNIAKALASTIGWNSSSNTCAVGNNPNANNVTGFSILPAGGFFADYVQSGLGKYAYFWSATSPFFRYFCYDRANVGRDTRSNGYGFSVRCVRDLPTVTTNSISNITDISATCSGNVTSDGGSSVTARGVCWSASQNPTISNSHTTDGNGTGSFISNIIGLQPNTTYYVRAYATDSQGTAYGNELNFTTATGNDGQPCPGMVTVTDIDNNTYNTVQIGNQCWMRENLRTTRYYNGTSIALGSSTSTTTAYRYYPNNDQSNVPTYGYLYNWKAVMGNSSSSSANPSGVQGICPTGWHVPSDAEWTRLTDYVSSQIRCVCGGYNSYIAKSIASTTEWSSSTSTCAVGNNPSANNATGFSALPAGYYAGNYGFFGGYAYFWSATESNGVNAYYRRLLYTNAYVDRYDYNEGRGFSVRCIHDEGNLPTVTTNTVSNITSTTATCSGNVIATGSTNVTAYGVCWSTSQNPTIINSHTTDGNGTGSFTSNIIGLQPNTTYYTRAYATNSAGTAYGEQRSFTTDFVGLPTVTTNTVNNITTSTVTCGGNVTSDGGATVTSRGVCWSTSQNPTISDSHTTDGNGTGNFTSNITGLQPNTTYYIRAYATNSQGTAYGSQVVFTTTNSGAEPCYLLNEDFDNGAIPTGWTVIDNDTDGYVWNHSSSVFSSNNDLGHNESSGCMVSASYINDVGALTPDNWLITPSITIPSNVSAASLSFWLCAQDASYAAEHYGVYITTNSNYTNINNYSLLFQETIDANGGSRTQGTWKQKTAVLQGYAGQTVHIAFRHFNCTDMYYLNIDDVTVQYDCSGGTSGTDGQPCPGAATVTDIDNNTYNTVQIGNQCWMKENLRTTHYSNGTSIALGSSTSTTTAYRYYPDDNSSNVSAYGYLYNWKAVMGSSSSSSANPSGAQGICPTGWHVPSDAEWTQLTDYVGSQNQYVCSSNSTCIAKALASTTGWNSSTSTCAVGNTPTSNNATGFSALPAGGHYDFYGSFGEGTYFWSATEYNVIDANCPNLFYYFGGVYRSITNKGNGFSVRCVRD